MDIILEKLQIYLDNEFNSAKLLLTKPIPWWCNPQENKMRTISRGLGAAMFAQELGAKFDDVEPMYGKFKKQVEDINVSPIRERSV